MYEDGFVVAVVPDVLKEDAAAEQGDLESLDVDVGAIGAPCVGSDGVGDQRRKESIKVEEEEDGPARVSGVLTVSGGSSAYSMLHISSSTRYTLYRYMSARR